MIRRSFSASQWFLALLPLLLCPLLLSAEEASNAKEETADARAKAAWEKILAGALLVDVRTPEEFEQGHLEGAKNIPLGEIERRIEEFGDDFEREIVVYCRTGRRSGIARTILTKRGYKHVFNGGGLVELEKVKPKKP
ncbi:MAG: rhodanese-like domain-containing protein [Deltaproteobacteria bacterium]|nr:MAG: rhodanese-like domain-containing protein [Deltaproteobacteria bacterium]